MIRPFSIPWFARVARDIRAASAEDGVGVGAIARDLVALNLHNQLGVRAYFQYRLFDPRIPYSDKKDYLPDSGRATGRLWSLLTPVQYRLPFRNKLVFNRVFGGQGLPVARVFGVYDPRVGFTVDGEELRNAADLGRWMRQAPENGFVFKALFGVEGYQVLVLSGRAAEDPASFITLSGDRFNADRLVEFTRNTQELERIGAPEPESYLMEERVLPHRELAELVGPTLCCVRVVTFIGLNGVPQILGAVYKIQPEPLGVDHLSYGAVGCWVDLESGALGPGRSRHHFGYTSVIPGTDKKFVGFKLPHWPEVKEVALKAASVLPWARAIGWDIAIADRGPVLIEGNAQWSTSLLQIPAPRGLMTGEFKSLCDTLAAGPATRQ
ncbi:MAG: sugar-transfer associated ATP-grasp domain-containing protein [Gemmatimonadales bacterium]